MKRHAIKDAQTRKSRLAKYIPDVTRSLFGLLEGMQERRTAINEDRLPTHSPTKRIRLDVGEAQAMVRRLHRGEVSERHIRECLTDAIEAQTAKVEEAEEGSKPAADARPFYLVPLFNFDDPKHDFRDPLFTFRPVVPVRYNDV